MDVDCNSLVSPEAEENQAKNTKKEATILVHDDRAPLSSDFSDIGPRFHLAYLTMLPNTLTRIPIFYTYHPS